MYVRQFAYLITFSAVRPLVTTLRPSAVRRPPRTGYSDITHVPRIIRACWRVRSRPLLHERYPNRRTQLYTIASRSGPTNFDSLQWGTYPTRLHRHIAMRASGAIHWSKPT